MSIKQFEKKIFTPFLGEPLIHIVEQDPLELVSTGSKTFDFLLLELNSYLEKKT